MSYDNTEMPFAVEHGSGRKAAHDVTMESRHLSGHEFGHAALTSAGPWPLATISPQRLIPAQSGRSRRQYATRRQAAALLVDSAVCSHWHFLLGE